MRAPVNVVTEIDHDFTAVKTGTVLKDHAVQLLEQVEATVDITNAVQLAIRRQVWADTIHIVMFHTGRAGFTGLGTAQPSLQSFFQTETFFRCCGRFNIAVSQKPFPKKII